MPKVSIIVPTYNRSIYLKETLNSILSQSFTDYEIIITDNNSTDDTENVVKSFSDPRIVYSKNPENVGSVNNYNEALKLVKGTYIHLFSDDDIMLADCLADKVGVLDKYPEIGVVHSDINTIDKNGSIISNNHYSFKVYKKWAKMHAVSKAFPKEMYHKMLVANNFVCMPAVMFRASVLNKIGLFDAALSYIVDWQYWLKASLYFDFYYINKKTVSYRIHDNNTVKKLSLRILNNELEHIFNDLVTNYKDSAIVKSRLQYWLIKVYYNGRYRHFYTNYLRWLLEFIR
ncbi:glycosyltransferase [Mucilaginibacter sp. dw_454]|uniref:glycosyltransferase n=1 Tax=Mucilaginibacter sp. dw_454 TaxID=2720079 RepID=UPI001BD20278|nr:glycosyltransferase [Mucilaginibacter sp. dw_454]